MTFATRLLDGLRASRFLCAVLLVAATNLCACAASVRDTDAPDGPPSDAVAADGREPDAVGSDARPDAPSACPRECPRDQLCSSGACVTPTALPAPRPIAPGSTALTTSQRPTFHWALAAGTDGARVELCATRACTTVLESFDASGASVTAAGPLAPGVHFWRLRARLGAAIGATTSPTWEFWVGARSAPVDTSWGTTLDVNGDGFADVVVGAPEVSGASGRAYVYLGSATGLATSPSVTLIGSAGADGNFGTSVASAGDVNGDGFADVVVGAWSANGNAGRAYVYLGSATGLSSLPAITLTAPAGAERTFASSVASAGDVNRDGYTDVIVGTYTSSPGPNRAYVYLGSATGLASTPATTITRADGAAASFGHSVAGAGDVNGDGFADVVVGGVAGSGASVYLGSASGLASVASTTLTMPAGVRDFARFGEPVASAGDVNGDGYADVVVGAATVSVAGLAFVYLGSATGLARAPATTLTVTNNVNGFFGAFATSAGDVNGDGFADVAALEGALGTVYVYLGSASGLSGVPATRLTGPDERRFDGSVASAGDVNGDGLGDLVVGTCSRYVETAITNRAYVYLGSASGPANAPATTLAAPDGRWFGSSVASAGDVNGDGFADVIAGEDGGRHAYVYLGSAAGLASVAATTLTAPDGRLFGSSVASAGDVNHDGYADVIVASAGRRGQTDRAYVYLGGPTGLAAAPAATLSAPGTLGETFGYSVASAGDVNRDGYADVVVGTRGGPFANADAGRVFVYLGRATGVASEPATMLEGAADDDRGFGSSVASAGDVNRDGFGDLIVGQYDALTRTGRAHVYFGSARGLTGVPATTLTRSAGANMGFGNSVASAGDVNADGFADVVVGASGGARAYVYLGSAAGLANEPATTLAASDATPYGGPVATAGDVNRDGFADVIVGESFGPFGTSGASRTFVYLGSAAGLASVPALTLTRPGGDFGAFGGSIASAGDVNGDGFADVIVGSHNGSATGHAYLYLGSPAGLAGSPGTTLTGPESARRLFGCSVASVSDVDRTRDRRHITRQNGAASTPSASHAVSRPA